jgi:hypothetical protein
MTAATPRIANRTSDGRRLVVVMGALIVAAALLIAVVVGQQLAKSSATSATGTSHELVVGHIRYTGIPYAAPGIDKTPVVNAQTGFVTNGVGVTHLSPTSDDSPSFKGEQYSTGGAPYPIPGVAAPKSVAPAIDDSTFFKNGISNSAPISSPYWTGGFSTDPYGTGTDGTPRQIGTR